MSKSPDSTEGAPYPVAPRELRHLQEQFGHAISRPLVFDDGDSGDYELSIEQYDIDLLDDIRPRMQASAAERLGIYNQQYWFRLLTVMQEEYPLTERLLGTLTFNKMVMAYLSAYPSTSPSLRHLSDRLVEFLQQDHTWNRSLVVESARLEYLFIHAFDAAALPVFDPSSLSLDERQALVTIPLKFQPHWSLLVEHWNLVDCRKQVKHNPERVSIQPSEQVGYWAIYRGEHGTIAYALDPLQYRLLDMLANGQTLGAACDRLLDEVSDEDAVTVAENIQDWFTLWAAQGWFVQPHHS